MKVKTLFANWRQVGSLSDRDGFGEDYDKYEVGVNSVVSIHENEPTNGNQLWNFLLEYEDGTRSRVFNPNYVEYFKDETP